MLYISEIKEGLYCVTDSETDKTDEFDSLGLMECKDYGINIQGVNIDGFNVSAYITSPEKINKHKKEVAKLNLLCNKALILYRNDILYNLSIDIGNQDSVIRISDLCCCLWNGAVGFIKAENNLKFILDDNTVIRKGAFKDIEVNGNFKLDIAELTDIDSVRDIYQIFSLKSSINFVKKDTIIDNRDRLVKFAELAIFKLQYDEPNVSKSIQNIREFIKKYFTMEDIIKIRRSRRNNILSTFMRIKKKTNNRRYSANNRALAYNNLVNTGLNRHDKSLLFVYMEFFVEPNDFQLIKLEKDKVFS